jgi:hypothetical protein
MTTSALSFSCSAPLMKPPANSGVACAGVGTTKHKRAETKAEGPERRQRSAQRNRRYDTTGARKSAADARAGEAQGVAWAYLEK